MYIIFFSYSMAEFKCTFFNQSLFNRHTIIVLMNSVCLSRSGDWNCSIWFDENLIPILVYLYEVIQLGYWQNYFE